MGVINDALFAATLSDDTPRDEPKGAEAILSVLIRLCSRRKASSLLGRRLALVRALGASASWTTTWSGMSQEACLGKTPYHGAVPTAAIPKRKSFGSVGSPHDTKKQSKANRAISRCFVTRRIGVELEDRHPPQPSDA